MTERMEAYRSYFDEVTANGNTRMENITLCAGHRDEHQQHIKRQVTLAFYGGWRLAIDHVDALLKAEREKALCEALAAVEGVERSKLADSENVLPPDYFDEGTSAAYEAILALISKDATP